MVQQLTHYLRVNASVSVSGLVRSALLPFHLPAGDWILVAYMGKPGEPIVSSVLLVSA